MTKIDIFSGFLGAGKTTLIKKLIAEAYQGEKVVLIENEFGEIGIDGGFLQDAGINIKEMNSGCICCSLVGDFTKALQNVVEEYHPDRIIIEPSGVGKLSDVIHAASTVDSDEAVLNCFTTVVDINKCKMYMKNFGEFFNDQIEHASCVVFSHTAKASDAKIEEAVALLREHNPNATVVTTDWAILSGSEILNAMEKKDTLHDILQMLSEEENHHHHHEDGEECHCTHHHDDDDDDEEEHHHHHHEDGEECHCAHHHDDDGDDDDNEEEHHHHHHEDGEECHCAHHHDDDDDDEEEHHHHHHEDGEECHCGHHHHHHADEVFTSWGTETTHKFTAESIKAVLDAFVEDPSYGMVLRAKGIVEGTDGKWIHFDYVPGEPDVRFGSAGIIGRLCVIGSKLDEEKIKKLFGV